MLVFGGGSSSGVVNGLTADKDNTPYMQCEDMWCGGFAES